MLHLTETRRGAVLNALEINNILKLANAEFTIVKM